MRRDDGELTGPRRALGVVVTCLVPLFLFAVCELGLRWADAGDVYPLFVEAEGFPGQLHANPRVIQRFYR